MSQLIYFTKQMNPSDTNKIQQNNNNYRYESNDKWQILDKIM